MNYKVAGEEVMVYCEGCEMDVENDCIEHPFNVVLSREVPLGTEARADLT